MVTAPTLEVMELTTTLEAVSPQTNRTPQYGTFELFAGG